MHDPTEGGLWSALWELAEAIGHSIVVDLERVFVPAVTAKICRIMEIDPFAAISSGALLLTAPQEDSSAIIEALAHAGIQCTDFGLIEAGVGVVWQSNGSKRTRAPRPPRDEIARLFENVSA
jgi:hydrogenase maturation factor